MRPNTKVLQGISLKIPAGKTCALVGKSGGGKSTLVHLMMRFYDPCSGDILLDGTNLRQLSLQHVHDECGLVAQDTQLFGSTVRQNIMYGVEDSIALAGEDVVQAYSAAGTYRGMCPRRIVEAAKEANCHDFIREFEDGYEHTHKYTRTHTHTQHIHIHTQHIHTHAHATHTHTHVRAGPHVHLDVPLVLQLRTVHMYVTGIHVALLLAAPNDLDTRPGVARKGCG